MMHARKWSPYAIALVVALLVGVGNVTAVGATGLAGLLNRPVPASALALASATPQAGIDCGCTTVGPYQDPAASADAATADPTVSSAGYSPNKKYQVAASASGSQINLTVTRVADSARILADTYPGNSAWGFSPDDDRFVVHSATNGVEDIVLYNLAASPAARVWSSSAAVSSSGLGFSPKGRYFLYAASGTSGNTLTVVNATTGATVLSSSFVSGAFWGFSPDDDRFVIHSASNGVEDVALYNLAASPAAKVWSSSAAVSSSRLGFSPNGHYFLYVALTGTASTSLTLVDATTGTSTYSSNFTFASPPGSKGDTYGVVSWGFSPDSADRSFVYGVVTGQSSVAFTLVNLATRSVTHSETITASSAYWQFSPCGDMLAIVTAAGQTQENVRLFQTGDGATPTGANQTLPLATTTLTVTTASHIATVNGTDYTLAPNTAGQSCGGGAPGGGGAAITIAALSVDPTTVIGGDLSTGTVTLSAAAPAGGQSVTLSTDSTAASVPASVTVLAGQTTATFDVQTTPVATDTTVTLTATLGASTQRTTLVVRASTVDFVSPPNNSVTGGQTGPGAVYLTGAAPAGGITVALSSDKPAVASVPANVIVPEGQGQADFTVNMQAVATDTTVTLTASAGGVTRTTTFTVLAPVLTSLSVTPTCPPSGSTVTGTVTLSGIAPQGGLTVTLTSSDAAASVPASVTVPAGQNKTTFTVTTAAVKRVTQATISATTGAVTLTTYAVLNPPQPAPRAGYTITDLGSNTNPQAVNSAGQVVGWMTTASGATHAFLWTASGGLTDLGTLGGNESRAYAINDSGVVVGMAKTSSGQAHAFRWTAAGGMTDLGTLPGGNTSTAYGINSSGQVVGEAETAIYDPAFTSPTLRPRAFLWTPNAANGTSGGMTDLGVLPQGYGKYNSSHALAINDAGWVVGWGDAGRYGGELHAFLWKPSTPNGTSGTMTDLGYLGANASGSPFSRAEAINASGQIVGISTAPDFIDGFLWQNGTLVDLCVPGYRMSDAHGINSSGQVVMSAAFLWTADSGMVDLNRLIPSSSGWSLSGARAINDAGQVVGSGTFNGASHAYLLTPVAAQTPPPPPSPSPSPTPTPTPTPSPTPTPTPVPTPTPPPSPSPNPSPPPGPAPGPPPAPGATYGGWLDTGGTTDTSPAMATFQGRLYVFARGAGQGLYEEQSVDGATFTPWLALGGQLTSAPATTEFNGRLYVFARGTDGTLYLASSSNGLTFTTWRSVGGILRSAPSAVSFNGQLYVFARGTDQALYEAHSADGVTFTPWRSLGGVLTADPAAVATSNGTLYALARGTDNQLYESHSANGVVFTAWRPLGGVLTSGPGATSVGNTVIVCARGTGDALYELRTTDGNTFTPWRDIGGVLLSGTAATAFQGQVYVAAEGTGNAIYITHTLP